MNPILESKYFEVDSYHKGGNKNNFFDGLREQEECDNDDKSL